MKNRQAWKTRNAYGSIAPIKEIHRKDAYIAYRRLMKKLHETYANRILQSPHVGILS